jgi:hypothetical protein
MTEVRTRDEELASIDDGLVRWAEAATDLLARAAVTVTAARSAAETEAGRWARLVAELTDLLAALPPGDKLLPVATANLARARQSLDAAERASAQLADVAARTAALQRSQAANTVGFVAAARADLARRGGELGAYRAAGAGLSAAPWRPGGVAAAAQAAPWLAGSKMSDFDVAQADFADNPIVGTFGRGGLSRADYRWAVSTWDELVRPGLDRGMIRDDFAARDAACGAPPLRRTADVYDMFLKDPIRVERRPDGSLNVLNGRHRLQIAGELGVTRLPAQWGG